MAYVLASETVESEGVSTSLEIPISGGHRQGDLLLVVVQQDIGSGVFSPPSGWQNAFPQTQVVHNSQRTYGWWKYASSENEPAFVLTSTLSENIIGVSFVVRGAHQSSPIDVASILGATGNLPPTPSVTTSSSNTLILSGIGNDSSNSRVLCITGTVTPLARYTGGKGSVAAGFTYSDTPGLVGPISYMKFGATSGGSGWIVAIRDDGNNARRTVIKGAPTVVRYFGAHGATHDPADSSVVSLNSITPTLDGVPTSTVVSNISTTTPPVTYNSLRTFWYVTTGESTTATVPIMTGAVRVWPASVDMSAAVVLLAWIFPTASTAIGDKGFYAFFGDIYGNWALVNISRKAGVVIGDAYTFSFDTASPVLVDSYGVMDWSQVNKFGVAIYRYGYTGTSTRGYGVRDLMLVRNGDIQVVSGGGQDDWSVAHDVKAAIDGPLSTEYLLTQGRSQLLAKIPLQFGNSGVNKADLRIAGGSIEAPQSYAPDILRRQNRVSDFFVDISVNAGPNDVIDFSGSVLQTGSARTFTITSSSSPSATYNFDGYVLSGWRVNLLQSLMTISKAKFIGCYEIYSDAPLISCSVSASKVSSAVTIASADLVRDCTFTQGPSGGHAIEITQPGTFSFVGNTFTGYGLDGTTDAAIYNNSGGHVVLNVSGGGDTPTVRNGAGATTEIVSGVTLTFAGIKPGSEIHIFNASSTLLASVESAIENQTISLQTTGIQARVFIASLGYENLDIPYMIPSSDATVPIFQRIDRNYRNPT